MTDQPPRNQPEPSRTIPDGGLAASGLPDWMQTRPDWSARREETDLPVMDARSVPESDTSTIDLANMLTAEDLPDWLREVAHRPVTVGDERDGSISKPLLPSGADNPQMETGLNVDVDPKLQPWWTSDRIMAGLLIAVILTILFVLITTIRLG